LDWGFLFEGSKKEENVTMDDKGVACRSRDSRSGAQRQEVWWLEEEEEERREAHGK
jgi:hypothetical protein